MCRSEAGDRHNIIATTGVLSEFDLDAHSLEEVCAALPPTLFDQVVASVERGAQHGAIRGVANVVGYTLRAQQVPAHIAQAIQQTIYYGSYFLLRYHEYMSQQAQPDWHHTVWATLSAAVDTGSMWAVTAGLNWLSQVAHRAEKQAHQTGWTRTGNAFKFFGDWVPYASYAYDPGRKLVVEQDIAGMAISVAKTVTSVTAGLATQQAIEQPGRMIVNRLL